MADTNGTEATTTPATATDTKAESILTTINQDWVKAGRKTPDAKTLKSLATNLKTAETARESAEASLAKAKDAEDVAVLALAKATGGAPISLGGSVRTFAARNGRVFFRNQRTEGVVSID